MNMFDLTDRVAIVSGTASGMGQAMATVFAENGAHIVMLDLNTKGNEETAHTLEKLGHRAIPLTWRKRQKSTRQECSSTGVA